jgi:uncharacterized membrane protein
MIPAARVAILATAALIIFGIVATVLLKVLPGPFRATDYLVIGVVSTLAALVTLFITVIAGWLKMRDVFYRRRQKPGT